MSAIELVYKTGFTGLNSNTLIIHPSKKNIILYPIGSMIVISDLNDPTNQEFLEGGHDETIKYLGVSSSGKYVFSTQIGSSKQKGFYATICVWSFQKKKLLYQIKEHKQTCNGISISHDDKFLVSIGTQKLCIWDLTDKAEYCGGLGLRGIGKLVTFCPKKQDFNPNRPRYEIIYADRKVGKCSWGFDLKTMNYKLYQDDFKLPGRMSGLKRTFTCVEVDDSGKTCFIGTKTGEIMIFNVEHRTFQTSLLVSSNGVYSMLSRGNCVFVGGGDSSLKIIENTQRDWKIVESTKLHGKVTSITMDENANLFSGSSDGKILELDSQNLKIKSVITGSHVDSVTSLSINKNCESFCTTSKDGTIIIWNLEDFSIMNQFKGIGAYPISSIYLEDTKIISGWNDGTIKCWDTSVNKLVWKIVNAHKGGVGTLAITPDYLLSGGDDGYIRIWRKKTRELLSQFSEHRKSVSKVIVDCKFPNLIHSCSLDRNCFSYDLKSNKRISYHSAAESPLKSMTQRLDEEYELVTCSTNALINFWDIDYKDSVFSIVEKSGNSVNSVSISPKTGKFLAWGTQKGVISIFDLSKKKVVCKLNAHTDAITQLDWTSDEKQIISVAVDSSISVLNFYEE